MREATRVIRRGRETVDRWGIAGLHGMSESVARRQRPWSSPQHPAPLNGRREAGRAPMIWDRAQAAAFAAGRPIPELPNEDHDQDLLDGAELARLAGVEPKTFYIYVRDGQAPAPDARPHDVPHWLRETATRWLREERPGRGHGGGRRARSETSQRTAEHDRVRAARAEAPDEGYTLAELAAKARVSRVTALKYQRLEEQASDRADRDADD